MKTQFHLFLVAAVACFALPAVLEAQEITYPETREVEVYDEYHGVKVLDRFQWLENDVREDEEVAKWVADQNKVTFGYIENLPHRDTIEKRLTTLWNYEVWRIDVFQNCNHNILTPYDALAMFLRILMEHYFELHRQVTVCTHVLPCIGGTILQPDATHYSTVPEFTFAPMAFCNGRLAACFLTI